MEGLKNCASSQAFILLGACCHAFLYRVVYRVIKWFSSVLINNRRLFTVLPAYPVTKLEPDLATAGDKHSLYKAHGTLVYAPIPYSQCCCQSSYKHFAMIWFQVASTLDSNRSLLKYVGCVSWLKYANTLCTSAFWRLSSYTHSYLVCAACEANILVYFQNW